MSLKNILDGCRCINVIAGHDLWSPLCQTRLATYSQGIKSFMGMVKLIMFLQKVLYKFFSKM